MATRCGLPSAELERYTLILPEKCGQSTIFVYETYDTSVLKYFASKRPCCRQGLIVEGLDKVLEK
jgi:hypothetical protein